MDGGFEDGRERASWTRRDAIYGVFTEGESDSDDDHDGSRRRKRRKGASEPDLSRPVLFVSAGNATPSQGPERASRSVPASASAAGANEEEEDMEPLPTAFGTRARREEKERERAAARRRQASGDPAPAIGSVGANTTVTNIMRGMGYEEGKGLGKDGQGNPEPMEIVMRPKNAGLGSVEGFKKPKPVIMSAKENLPPASTKEQPARWSKKASARKAPVLTKHEARMAMRAEQEQQPAVVEKLIDMRGPQPRVLTILERLNDEPHEMVVADEDAPMPELQYNVRLLVDGAGADVARLDGHLRREQETAASLAREKEKLSSHEASQKRQMQVMEAIAAALDQVRADEAAGVLTLDGLLHTFQGLKARFEEEFNFKMCGTAWIACQFAHPLLLRAFHGWQPLEDPSFGLDVMSSWKDLLEGDLP